MQTFLAHENFALNAALIDWRRANKQIIESRQIALAMTDPDYGWKNHPATKMWWGHVAGLLAYTEHFARAYREGVDMVIMRRDDDDVRIVRKPSGRDHKAWTNMLADHDVQPDPTDMPAWWHTDDRERVLVSHRNNLVHKDADYYGRIWTATGTEYFWPV